MDEAAEHGEHLEFLDRAAVQAEVHSPLWQAGLYRPPGRDVVLDPAALCRGIARVARERGVRVHEGTAVTRLERRAGGVLVRTASGATVRAGQVVVATSAYSGGCAAWDRCSCRSTTTSSCPSRSTPDERRAIGWARRQGLSDANNQFHYFRLTADDRILWGGYDAIHYSGSRVGPELDRRPATFEKLEAQFFRAFPQLEGLRFPYRWGGAIDTTSRFTVTFGQTMGGRVTYALGYTGLGVGHEPLGRGRRARPPAAARRGPPPAADRGQPADPVPARALRSIAVDTVRHELDRADRDEGRRVGDPADARRARDRLRLLAVLAAVLGRAEEVERDVRLVADHDAVVARADVEQVAGPHLELGAVGHHDAVPPRHDQPDVGDRAERLAQRLARRAPTSASPARTRPGRP